MSRQLCLVLATTGLMTVPALAQESDPAQVAHEMREAHMHLFSYNLGPLGAMAQGDIEFDAARAELHAANIANLARVNFSPYWVEGSSTEDIEDSRALPAIWDNLDDLEAQRMDLVEAAEALASAAGEGEDAFRGAMRELGQACGGCHEDYREEEEED